MATVASTLFGKVAFTYVFVTVRSQPWIIPTIYTLAAQLRAEASGPSVYECILLPSSADWEPVTQLNSNNVMLYV